MTAPSQAGAVAAWVDPDDFPLAHSNGQPVDLYPTQIGDAYVPLYRQPPAAVPVEALEGLVERWRKEDCRDLPGINNTRIAVDTLLDELTTLIKERSNG